MTRPTRSSTRARERRRADNSRKLRRCRFDSDGLAEPMVSMMAGARPGSSRVLSTPATLRLGYGACALHDHPRDWRRAGHRGQVHNSHRHTKAAGPASDCNHPGGLRLRLRRGQRDDLGDGHTESPEGARCASNRRRHIATLVQDPKMRWTKPRPENVRACRAPVRYRATESPLEMTRRPSPLLFGMK